MCKLYVPALNGKMCKKLNKIDNCHPVVGGSMTFSYLYYLSIHHLFTHIRSFVNGSASNDECCIIRFSYPNL